MTKTEAGLAKRLRKQAKCVYLAAEKSVADDISDGLSQAASLIERQSRALVEAREALATARVHVNSQSVAEHMMDGFGPRKPRESDANLDAVDAALARIDAALQEGQK